MPDPFEDGWDEHRAKERAKTHHSGKEAIELIGYFQLADQNIGVEDGETTKSNGCYGKENDDEEKILVLLDVTNTS